MPIDNKKLKNLYDAMRQEGYDQSYDEFRGAFLGNNNYANRKDIYDTMSSGGYNLGKTYAEFMRSMYIAPQQANKNAAAQAAAAKSAPTQPTKGGWRPNAEQMAGYQRFTDGVLRTVKNGDDVMNRVNRQVARATRPNQQKVNLGFNNKHSLLGGGSQVQHEGKKFDAAKGDFVDQYSTEAGNVYDNTYEADAEQYNINRNKRDADTLDAVADIERQIREQEELLEKTRKASRNVEAPDNLWDAIRYTMSHADGPRLDQEDIDEEAIKAKITNLQNKRSLLLHGTSIGQKVGKSIGDQLAEVNRMIGDDIDNYYKRHPNGGPTLVSHDYHATGQYQINPYLDVAARSLEDAQEMFNEAGKSVGESGLTGFGKGVIRGFGSKLFDARTWDMGFTDIKGGLSLAEVLKKADEGKPLTVEQQKMLDAKATELACAAYFSGALGRGYKAGQVTAESIPFMLEFMLNPLSRTGMSAQAMLTRYALKRFGRKATMELGEDAAKKILYGDIRQLTKSVFDKGLSKGARRLAAKTLAGKASARIAGDITGAAGMTATTGQGRVAADLLNRTTGQVKFKTDDDGKVVYAGHDAPEESNILKAYAKSFGSQFIENHSEFMGEYFPYIGAIFSRGLDKIGGKYIVRGLSTLRKRSASAVMRLPFAPMAADFIRHASKSDWAKAIHGMQKRAHWNGTLNEYLEEVAGNIENAILVGDNDFSTEEGRGVFNLSDNIDTFLGVGLMSGAMSVASAAGYRTPAYRARKMVENADARGEKLLGSSLWGKFKSSFDAAQSEQDKQVILTSLLQNSSLTNEGRRAALQYASGKQFQQAVADGTFREMEEDAEKGNEVERACRAEYAEGQNIDNVEEMRDAKTRYNVLLREALAVEPNAEMYSDPQFYEQSNPNATPEQKAAMRAYAEAKAQYEGVADRMKTDMADQQQKANEQVDRFKNQTDGLITRVRLRGSDAEFYVTSGHISLNNDGTINDAATSSNLTIVDGEGNQRFISRGDVVDVLAQNTPEETLEQLNDIIMNEAKAKADLIDGKLSFRAGDTFTILNNEGQEQKVTIAQDPSTMAMSAVIEGEQAAVPLTEDSMAKLQQMSDAYQESRFGKYRQEQQDAVANAENEATQEGAAPASPTSAQEETSAPTEGRSYGYGESVSYVDGEGHTQEGVVHGKTPEGTYEVEFDNPPSGKEVVDEYTQEELDALVQPIPAGQTEEVVPEQVPEEEPAEPQGNDAADSVPPTTEELVEMARGGNELAQYQLEAQGIPWKEPAEQTKDNVAAQSPKKDVPRDKDGNIIYDQVPVATTIEDLYDGALDDEEIGNFVQSQIDAANKAVDKITKKKPQISTNKSAYLEAKKKWEGELREAERKAQYWNDVKAEVEKITTPADARGWKDELSGEAARRQYRENSGNDHEAKSASEVAAEFFSQSHVKVTPESYRKETGFGLDEQRKMVGKISKEGKTIDRLSEELALFDEEYYNGRFFGGDSMVAKDALIAHLSSADARKGVSKVQSEAEAQFVEDYEEQRERYYQERYHMSYEEYIEYSAQEMPELMRKYSNFDEQQFYNRYADEIEADLTRREQQSNNNNGTEENDSTREEQRHDRGNQVQSGQRTDDNSGSEGGEDSEGAVRTRDEGSDEQKSSSEESAVGGQREQETDIEQVEGANEVDKSSHKTDNQGNPLNADGTLKLEKVKSVDDLTDEDFSKPTRSVELPQVPENVDNALGADGKPVIIKKNIFEKNWEAHKFPFAESRSILKSALYNTDLVGQTQPTKRPLHWVAIKLDEKSPIVVLEVNENKDNVEIVGWYTLDGRNLERIKRQAEKNGGELVMLSPKDKVESLSTPQSDLSSDGKGKEKVSSKQGSVGRKNVYGKNKVADWRTSVSSAMRQYETSPHDAHVAMCDIIDGMDSNALYGLMRMVLRTITSLDNENIRDGWKVDATHDLFDILKDRGFVVTKGSKGVAIGDVVIDKHGIIYVVEGVGKSRLDCGLSDVNDKTIIDHMTISRASVKYYYRDVNGKKDSVRLQKADVVDAELMAEEKPFNAIIEMLRKKFPDASMEALTAADRLLREQALPGERQKAIEAVAKALGLKVEWRDTMEKENGTFNPKTRTITIARDSEHALANTFGHEVTHAVRNLSEADYKNLKDAVRRLYSSEKEYNEAVQAYGDMYTGLDFDALEEELIADNIGFMIGGRNDMTQELASRMNHRVLWAIHDAMNKVRNALAKVLHIDSKKNGLLEAIDSARATIRETMANAQRIAKEKGQGLSNESDSARQSLRTQDTAIRDALVERMRLSGMDVITDEAGQRVLDMANSEEVMLSAKQKRALETATIAEQATNNATVVSSADGAKIQNNLEILADNYKKRPNKTRGFITDLSRSLGLVQHEASQYGTFETRNGKLVTIRVSNHNARVSFFDENGEEDGISIVISSHKNKGALNDGKAHLVEYFYPKQSLERSGSKPLADIVKCVSNALDSGKFDDATGIAQRQEVNAKQIREQRVYHGSGAEFDHFDHGHMGEGQGSQAFGWGTYVTSSKAIGESYAQDSARGDSPRMEMEYTGDALTDKEVDLVKYAFDGGMRSYHETEEFLENIANSDKSGAKRSANALALLRKTKPEDWTHPLIGKRQLYTVEIPEDNGSNYLDWKAKVGVGLLNKVNSQLEQQGKRPINPNIAKRYEFLSGEDLYETLSMRMAKDDATFNDDKAASEFLSSLGLVGIKYPAGTIHGGAKEGDTNYVIFNEKDAKITDHVRFFRTANGEAYGFTVGGKIYIDPRIATSETPVHEYAHLWATALKSANAKEWQNVVGLMKGTKVWDEVKALYPELKSDDEIADEVLATYSGRRGAERLREEQRRIAKGNGNVFEKAEAISALESVKQALKRFWKGIADFLHIHYTSAEEVADRVMKDLLDGVDPRKFGDGGKSLDAYNKIRKHFIGEQGAERADHAEEVTTRIDNLNVAREMEDVKKDAKAIKMATGWERGADGKWRYEIPDLKYFSNGYAGWKKARARQPWIQELDALSDKLFEGEDLSDSEMARFDELAAKESAFKAEFLNREKPHLADWVENDELFKAYPDLKRVKMVFTDQLPTNVGGSYNEREHTIVVNTNYVGDTDSVLAHEVQHAIQKIEGFAKGGNPETIRQRIEDYVGKNEEEAENTKSIIKSAFDLFGKASKLETIYPIMINSDVEWQRQTATDAYWDALNTIDNGFRHFETEVKNDYSQFKGMSPYEIARTGYHVKETIKELKRMSDEYLKSLTDDDRYLEELVDRYKKALESDSDAVLYTKLSGEVESRNVERRMAMSTEERRASLAAETEDVSREDQIFLFGEGGTSMKTSSDLNEMFGNRWLDEQTNDDGRHTTQVKSTINSYKKFGDWVKRDSNGRDVDVLDASSGLGLGTAWMRDNGFKVDDVEPFPSDSREAPTFSSYDEIDKKYDYIISNAVLNVIPDDWRANVLHQMADKLKDGGKLVINVRGAEGIRKQGKEGETRITLDSPSEILVLRPNGSIKAYQKGFTKSELKEWCEKELGEGYSVEIANNKNAGGSYDTAVVVTKNNESGTVGVASEAGHPSWSAQALPSSVAKLEKNQEYAKDLAKLSGTLSKKVMGAHEFLFSVAKAFGFEEGNFNKSFYKDLGSSVGIRISDHSANPDNIINRNDNSNVYGLVIKLSNHRFKSRKDANYLEYVYYPDKLTQERQQEIVGGLEKFLETGDYAQLPSPDRVNRSGVFDRRNDIDSESSDVKQSRRGTPNLYPDHIAQAIYEQSVNGFKFDLDEAWHDSLLSVKRLQEAISETRGVPIRDFENAYWHAVALSSVNAAEMEQLMNLRIQPFIEAVQDICKKHDLTQEDIEVYLNCKHGLERNEAMARKFAEAKAEEEFEAELKKAQKTATANPNDQDAADALDDVKQRMNDREEELYFENREKDYSGLTDIFDPKDKVTGDRLDLTVAELEDEAKKYVKRFEAEVGVADVTKLWDNIHELNNYSLRKSYLSGLISKSQYDSVKQMYQWYVPLRGFNEEVAGDVYTYVTRGETRTQQLLKEAKGRTSRAGDILATMMNMANSAVNQGNRNLMKQKILNLALNAKSPLLSVSSTWYQTDANGFDVPIEPPINDQMTPSEQRDAIEQWEDTMEMQAKQGKVHRMSDNLRLNLRTQKWQADEHCIRVQRGGKEYCVWVNGNPRAAQALNDRLGNQVTKPYKATETILDKAEELFTDGFIKIFRYMAQSVTSLNPEFVISNFQRDLASASLISTGKYGVGYTKDFLVNVKRLGVLTGTMSHKKEYRNAAGIYTLYSKYKSGNLDNNNEMERYFAEFMQNGGETGYTQSLSIKDYQSRIQSALGDKGFVKWSKNAGHAVADFVEMANRGVENTCRFAAYMTSRQHGKSVLQSIVDAKEASTNFNLHGAGGFGNAWLRKSIIFINPAVQSIVQYCQLTAKHPKAMLSMLGGTILLGAAMAFACASMVAPGGGDPDSNYWDLSDYVRHNYIVIPSGNGNWTRIALPPEIRAVYGLGVIAMEAAMGRMNHSSIPAAIGDQLMQFSPVAFLDPRNFFNRSDSDHSVGKTLIKAFTPTLASPIADAYIWDEDFMGRQITGRNDFNEDKPEFQRVSYDTLPQLVSFSRWLNNISGGNDYKKGWINVNPSAAGYVASQYLGGPLQFFTKIGKTVAMITYEDLRDMRNVPFLSRFMTSTDNDYGRNQVSNAEFKYWSAIADDVRTQIRGFEKEIESGDTKNLDDYKKLVSSKEYEMYQMIDYMDWLKDIRELNQKRKEETTQDAQKQVTLEIYEVRRKMAECLNKAEEMGVYLEMSQLNLELANAKTTEERAAIQAKINEKRKENLKKIGAIE